MRVAVTDRKTGEMALLWESGKDMEMEVGDGWMGVKLDHNVRSHGWAELRQIQVDSSLPFDGFGQERIRACAGFSLRVVPDQEEVDEADRKFVVTIMPVCNHCGEIEFKISKAETVTFFLRSPFV